MLQQDARALLRSLGLNRFIKWLLENPLFQLLGTDESAIIESDPRKWLLDLLAIARSNSETMSVSMK